MCLALLSTRYYPHPQPKARSSFSDIYAHWKTYATSTVAPQSQWKVSSYRSATILIAWRTGVICYSIILIGSLPVLICVAIAKSHFSGVRGSDYEVHLGIAAQLL
jgi:hypothetical protein